ncbi:MAG: hypothetical protein ACTHL8_24365 [Burkholderiaceae bacterium]
MSSNVINLFDIRRARTAEADSTGNSDPATSSEPSKLPVQLDLPFEGASAPELASATYAFIEGELARAQSALLQQDATLYAADGGAVTDAAAGSSQSNGAHADKYLFFAHTDAFAFQDDFLNFCKAMAPDLVVDLRVAPRLDFVRPLRKHAFELFEMCDIEYRDMFGRLNAGTYDLPQGRFEELINAVASLHTNHDSGRPTLGLFDNPTVAQFCTAKLAKSIPVVALDADTIRRMVAEGARVRM